MIFNERLFKRTILTFEKCTCTYVLDMWSICMNAEECLPTSRSIPSHQPYVTSSPGGVLDTENPNLRLVSIPHEFAFSTTWNFIWSLILTLPSPPRSSMSLVRMSAVPEPKRFRGTLLTE